VDFLGAQVSLRAFRGDEYGVRESPVAGVRLPVDESGFIKGLTSRVVAPLL
jgi:hypothetical protein